MLQRQTNLFISDGTYVKWLQVFHLYKGSYRKNIPVGLFSKGSAKIVKPPRVEYKGFKRKYNKKGDICRTIFIKSRWITRRYDGMTLRFGINSAILIKKKQQPKSKYIYGITSRALNRKKFLSLYKFTVS